MTTHDDGARMLAETLVAIFTEAHGRPPADMEELDTFIEMDVQQLRRGKRLDHSQPRLPQAPVVGPCEPAAREHHRSRGSLTGLNATCRLRLIAAAKGPCRCV
jgi:hypothetical protein